MSAPGVYAAEARLVDTPTLDASTLPDAGYGSRAPLWWGNLLLCVIEGMMFVLMAATYFYLRKNYQTWPPGSTPRPDASWGTALVLVMLVCLGLQEFVRRRAVYAGSRRSLIVGMALTTVLCFVLLGLRAMEFPSLNVQWDSNAYGSTLWTILGLHTVHLLAETGETALLTWLVLVKDPDHNDRLDLECNAFYWYFVTLIWIPLYALVYFGTRIL